MATEAQSSACNSASLIEHPSCVTVNREIPLTQIYHLSNPPKQPNPPSGLPQSPASAGVSTPGCEPLGGVGDGWLASCQSRAAHGSEPE